MQRNSLRQRARARLQRRVGQHLVGLHRAQRPRRASAATREQQRRARAVLSRLSLRRLQRRARSPSPAAARRRAAAGRTATARRRMNMKTAPSQISSTMRLVDRAAPAPSRRPRIAERKIKLADAARHQRGLGGRHVARREGARRRLHSADQLAVDAMHREAADDVAIVRPLRGRTCRRRSAGSAAMSRRRRV